MGGGGEVGMGVGGQVAGRDDGGGCASGTPGVIGREPRVSGAYLGKSD